jgi:hypothetical protein
MISFSSYEKNNKNFNIYFNNNTVISNQNKIAQKNNISNIQNKTAQKNNISNIQNKTAQKNNISNQNKIAQKNNISNQNKIAQKNNISNIQNMTNLTTLINTQQKIANQFHISLDSQILNEPSNDISKNTNSSPSINQSNLIENEKFKSDVNEFFDKIKLRMLEPRLKRIESKLKSIGVNNTNKINEIIKRLSLSQSNEFLNELEKLCDILSSDDLEKKLHPKVVKAIKESTNGLSRNEGIGIKVKPEFETLEDFAIKLLTDSIDALANPNSISQGSKGTCAQTTVERSIAERNPNQYVKIITDLITKGEYIAPNGQRIPLNEGGIKKALSELENRYLTTRIITPSFMEFFYDKNPDKNDYNDFSDRERGSSQRQGSSTDKTASAIYNADYKIIDLGKFDNNTKILILETLLKLSKHPVFLYVDYTNDGILHAVELKNITNNSINISNPWAQVETYTTNGKQIQSGNSPYETPMKDYQDFINRIGFVVVSGKIAPLLVTFLPYISRIIY